MKAKLILPFLLSAAMAAAPFAHALPVFAEEADITAESTEIAEPADSAVYMDGEEGGGDGTGTEGEGTGNEGEGTGTEGEGSQVTPKTYTITVSVVNAEGTASGMYAMENAVITELDDGTFLVRMHQSAVNRNYMALTDDKEAAKAHTVDWYIAGGEDGYWYVIPVASLSDTFSACFSSAERVAQGKDWSNVMTISFDAESMEATSEAAVTADEINIDPAVIPAEGIALSADELSLAVGDTAELTAELTPENATTAVEWASDNEEVATVADGVVTAVAAGTATVTASAGDDVSAACTVTVSDLEITELTASSTTGMFKTVSGAIVKNPVTGKTVLRFALSGTGYQDLFAGTYEQAKATTDADPIDTSSWVHFTLNDEGKYEFEVPITEGQTFIPIAALSYSYAQQGEYRWYPRQLVIDYEAGTLVSGDYDHTVSLTMTNFAADLNVSKAELQTIGGPLSNNYAEILKLTMSDEAYTKAFIGTADDAAAADEIIALSEDNVFAIPVRANATGGTLLYDYLETTAVISFFNAETESWVEMDVTASKENSTLDIKPSNELMILTQPVNAANAKVGDTVTFSVEAYNADSYQWYFSTDGETWKKTGATGARTDTLTMLLTAANINYQYYCEVKGAGTTLNSNIVRATFASLRIQSQPYNVQMVIGQEARFQVRIYRSDRNLIPEIQWYYSKDGGTKWYKSTGTASDNGSTSNYIYCYLTVTPKNAAALNTIYRAVITCPDGTKLTSSSAGCANIVAITAQPTASMANEKAAVLKVSANYAAGYQWYYSKDGGSSWYKSKTESAATNVLFMTYKEASAEILYRVKVTGTSGAVITSDSVRLGDCVNNPIDDAIITKQPSGLTVGKTAVISLTAAQATAYQWYYSKDGGNKWYKSTGDGSDTNTLNVPIKKSSMGSIYRCKVTGIYETDTWSENITLPEVAANVVDDAYIAALMKTANFGSANCFGTNNCFGSMAFKPLVDAHNYYNNAAGIADYLKGVFAENEDGSVYMPASALSRISYTLPLTMLNFGMAYSAYKEYVDRNGLEMDAEIAESARLAVKYFNTVDYTKEGYNGASGTGGFTFLSEAIAVVALGSLLGQYDTERFETLAHAAYGNVDPSFWAAGQYITPFSQLCAHFDWFDKSTLPAVDPSAALTAANVQNYYAWGIDVANEYPALWNAFVASSVQDGVLSAAEAKAFTYYYVYRETNGAAFLGVYGGASKVVDLNQYLPENPDGE